MCELLGLKSIPVNVMIRLTVLHGKKSGCELLCLYLNENKAELLTLAGFCSAAQVEFPIRESYIGTVYQRSAAPMHPFVALQRAPTPHIWSCLMQAEHTHALINTDRFAVKCRREMRTHR